ncbi:hypothetical protein GJ744_000224 [Endocarpon pusillum]|uniref:Uncharacterized protein n=1 Tax=Endocarpon pusillum TaxID=364733 RepID=A0A8H7AU60_9EURO|nr:hypothetical protein GJ744_000224 [Endocarpon pusillum]
MIISKQKPGRINDPRLLAGSPATHYCKPAPFPDSTGICDSKAHDTSLYKRTSSAELFDSNAQCRCKDHAHPLTRRDLEGKRREADALFETFHDWNKGWRDDEK